MQMGRGRPMVPWLTGLAAAVAAALVGLGARALVRRWTIRRRRGRATTADAAFVMAAVAGHVRTIALGEVAGVRAAHGEVRDFGQLLAEHHTQALTDLEALAAYLGIGIETHRSARLRRLLARLEGAAGESLDRLFLREIRAGHDLSARLYAEAVRSAACPDLRAYAAAQGTHLQAHGQIADALARHLAAVAA